MTLLSISTSFILFISVAGAVQGFILATLLYFHPRSDRSVTLFLSLHIFTVSILMVAPFTHYFFDWQSIIFHLAFQFLIGPFLYLYVRSFKERITWRKAMPHLLLFVIIFISAVQSYSQWIKRYPTNGEVPREVLLDPYTYLRVAIRNVQTIIYFILARKELISYQRSIHHIYSETTRINLNWVKWLLNGFLLIIIMLLIVAGLIFIYPEKFNVMILVVTAVLTPYIYIVTFKGISQTTLWQADTGKSRKIIEKQISEAQTIGATKKSETLAIKGLTEDRVPGILSNIILLMEKDKLYQEPELTLQALSDKLGIQSYQASQAINDGLQKNFYDLVNGYRVEEAKRLLLDPRNSNYTILSVGFEAGFNSKTTFHTVFKKLTGLTPTEFREHQRASMKS
jgi:AraC-like DNA-binding protein